MALPAMRTMFPSANQKSERMRWYHDRCGELGGIGPCARAEGERVWGVEEVGVDEMDEDGAWNEAQRGICDAGLMNEEWGGGIDVNVGPDDGPVLFGAAPSRGGG